MNGLIRNKKKVAGGTNHQDRDKNNGWVNIVWETATTRVPHVFAIDILRRDVRRPQRPGFLNGDALSIISGREPGEVRHVLAAVDAEFEDLDGRHVERVVFLLQFVVTDVPKSLRGDLDICLGLDAPAAVDK